MDKPIKKAANDRTNLINGLIGIIENKLGTAQDELFRAVIETIVDKMDRDGERVKNTLANKRLIGLVDKVFTDYAKGKGADVSLAVIKGVGQIMSFNEKYFSLFTKPAELAPINQEVKATLNSWLGISARGNIEPNGYLDTLINDPRIKNYIKDLTARTIISQAGFFETKRALKDFIVGTDADTGALKKYYRNFVYDAFSTIDRTAGKVTADKLKLNYAIYEGGLVEKSRKFCIEHNGKVYSREEIAEMDITEARPPGYNPFTDMGGYGCRHHWNWIPEAVALAMRPDLKTAKPKAAAPVKKVEPPAEPTPKKAAAKKAEPVRRKFNGTKEETKKDLAEAFEKNIGMKVKAVDFHRDLTPEKANRLSRKVNELLEEYTPPTFTNISRPEIKFASTGGAYGSVSSMNSGGNITNVNFGHTTDTSRGLPERVEIYERYRGIKGRRFAPKSKVDPDKEELATVVHEFAHFISVDRQTAWANLDDRLEPFWKEMKSLKRKYSMELGKHISFVNNESEIDFARKTEAANEIYLGDYANTNLNEFMAEAFTEYKLNSKPSKYAKLVGQLIDKYFKLKKQ